MQRKAQNAFHFTAVICCISHSPQANANYVALGRAKPFSCVIQNSQSLLFFVSLNNLQSQNGMIHLRTDK
jgi:hypothetical protein